MALLASLREFWEECKRVLKITKKPTKEELSMILKVTALGTVAIGLLGFIITIIRKILAP